MLEAMDLQIDRGPPRLRFGWGVWSQVPRGSVSGAVYHQGQLTVLYPAPPTTQSSIMPKVAGRFRAAAKTSSLRDVKLGAPPEAESSSEKEAAALSRGQRKRLANREQYLKREKMVMSSLRLQRLEQEKGKLDGLLAIREALGEACSSHPPKSLTSDAKDMKSDATKKQPTCNTNRSKKAVANREISHMGLVLEHPSFRENPFAAIQQHLRNSLAPEAEQMKQKSQKRDVEDDEVEAKKKEERKERLREAKFSKKKKGRGFRSNRSKR